VEVVGNGTYGQVYKVCGRISSPFVNCRFFPEGARGDGQGLVKMLSSSLSLPVTSWSASRLLLFPRGTNYSPGYPS